MCSILFLTFLFIVGPKFSLEARHHRSHFSLNFGPVFSGGPRTYVVERRPAYVEKHVYVDPYGYPYRERVYVHPARRTYVYQERPACFSGLSFGFGFFR